VTELYNGPNDLSERIDKFFLASRQAFSQDAGRSRSVFAIQVGDYLVLCGLSGNAATEFRGPDNVQCAACEWQGCDLLPVQTRFTVTRTFGQDLA
jgi:hypothetical protein